MFDTTELEEFIREHKGPGYSHEITNSRIVLTLDDPWINGGAPAISFRTYETNLWERLRGGRELRIVEKNTATLDFVWDSRHEQTI